jgi:hypothetical protein
MSRWLNGTNAVLGIVASLVTIGGAAVIFREKEVGLVEKSPPPPEVRPAEESPHRPEVRPTEENQPFAKVRPAEKSQPVEEEALVPRQKPAPRIELKVADPSSKPETHLPKNYRLSTLQGIFLAPCGAKAEAAFKRLHDTPYAVLTVVPQSGDPIVQPIMGANTRLRLACGKKDAWLTVLDVDDVRQELKLALTEVNESDESDKN